jgi:peptidoglycan hydrolase-like protein with peptidoglycan-binding domain
MTKRMLAFATSLMMTAPLLAMPGFAQTPAAPVPVKPAPVTPVAPAPAAAAPSTSTPAASAPTTTPSSSAMPAHRAAATPAQHAMRMQRVESLQTALNANGATLTVDGKMGAKTKAALMDFQKAHGLKVTGHLDKETIAALKLAG